MAAATAGNVADSRLTAFTSETYPEMTEADQGGLDAV